MSTSNADLLKSLKIDRSAPTPPASKRGLWIALAVVAVLVVLAIAAWALFGRDKGIAVQTADVVAIGNGGGSASVLDATGYVVARRMATVSSKITGKVRDIMIEEGQRIEAGQVMATLDPIDANAQRDLAGAQLLASQSQIESVRAQLRDAETNATRLGALVGQKLVSRAQYDQAVSQRDALRAQVTTALLRLPTIRYASPNTEWTTPSCARRSPAW
jgi:multidrug efflux pump subunit AcrA (membrane-fusion protein)